MENTKKANNPDAFPQTDQRGNCYTGMSLRDYFAAKAMQSIIANETLRNAIDKSTQTGAAMNKGIAIRAYSVADEMLKTRENETI